MSAAQVLQWQAGIAGAGGVVMVLTGLGGRISGYDVIWLDLVCVILGIVLWVAVLFVSATFGLLTRPPLLPIAAGFFVLAVAAMWRALDAAVRSRVPFRGSMSLALCAGAAPAIVLTALVFVSLTPYVGWDDSVYHLTLPRIYLAHRGFVRVPFNVYSNWPLGGTGSVRRTSASVGCFSAVGRPTTVAPLIRPPVLS